MPSWIVKLAALLLCVPSALAGGLPATGPAVVDHADLDRILDAVVRDQRVDYLALRRSHLDDLARYVERIQAVAPSGLERDERLALYINLYNAVVLREVTRRYAPGYSVSANDFELFDEKLIRQGGAALSLNDLEHRIIRPGFDEPRIHAALVCAAVSCPPLSGRAYTADTLERMLETNMSAFVNDRSRNIVDPGARRLRLSRLFDWYAEDFGGVGGRVGYVERYAGRDLSGFDVSFADYDWSLNITE